MTNLDSIFKSRDIILPTKVHLAKGMVFPVVMYGCESWTVKKAECQRIDAFELFCWRRLLRFPWTARRSVLGDHWKDRGWNSNTLATSCKELTHLKRPWCRERLKSGGEGDDSGWDGLMALLTQWRRVWVNSGSWWRTRKPGMLESMGSQRVGHDWATELNWWTIVNWLLCPWDFPGNNTGVGSHFLFKRIFLTQGSNLHLLCLLQNMQILYR